MKEKGDRSLSQIFYSNVKKIPENLFDHPIEFLLFISLNATGSYRIHCKNIDTGISANIKGTTIENTVPE